MLITILLMIVGDLDLEGVALPPEEANSPLIVDPNAVPAFSITRELFEAVSWRNPQICQGICCIQNPKLNVGPALNIPVQTAARLPVKNLF